MAPQAHLLSLEEAAQSDDEFSAPATAATAVSAPVAVPVAASSWRPQPRKAGEKRKSVSAFDMDVLKQLNNARCVAQN